MNYQELGYSLPKISAPEAAAQAIAILEDIAKVDGACLFYCVQASNILALAGLRGESPYNEFHPDFSQEKQDVLKKILHAHGHEIMYERTPYDNDTRNTFCLHNVQAFDEIPERYHVIRPFWKKPVNLADFSDYFMWYQDINLSLVRQMEDNKLPKEWLLDWWAPHNLCFGMILGYPGPAISSLCWAEARHAQNKPDEQEVTPSFPFQGIYCGTHIDFGYSPSLKDNPVMQKHERLWTETLTLVYEAFSEDRLLNIPAFKEEYQRFRVYDES